jgi:hypothetical protein
MGLQHPEGTRTGWQGDSCWYLQLYVGFYLLWSMHSWLGCRNGLNMRPNPFQCRITPRTPEIRATVDREGEEALQRLAIYDGETKYRMSQWYTRKWGQRSESRVWWSGEGWNWKHFFPGVNFKRSHCLHT